MRSFTWSCPNCRAILNTLSEPGAWGCPFCHMWFHEPPSYVVDGDGS